MQYAPFQYLVCTVQRQAYELESLVHKENIWALARAKQMCAM